MKKASRHCDPERKKVNKIKYILENYIVESFGV